MASLRPAGLFLIYWGNLLSSYIIKKEAMPRRVHDEQYDNDKELKKGHTFISLKKRLKLIQLVFEHKMTIYKAAKRLKICQPTAKFIIKSYRKGRIYEYEGQVLHLQQSPLKPLQHQHLQISSNQAVATPALQIQPEKSQKVAEGTVCASGVWANINNQLFLLPFYYYQ